MEKETPSCSLLEQTKNEFCGYYLVELAHIELNVQ